MKVLFVMLELFGIMLIGYILNKIKLIDNKKNKFISSFVINISMPALIVSSVCKNVSQKPKEVISFFIIGVILYSLLSVLSYFIIRLLRIGKNQSGLYQFMIVFGNVTFIGFPVVSSLYGQEAIFVTSILNMPFYIFVFSLGIYLICQSSSRDVKVSLKNMISPGIVASVIALIIYFAQINVPNILAKGLGYLGKLTTPLSMIVLGVSLAQIPIKDIFTEKKIYIYSIVKLVILPVVAFLLISLYTNDRMLIGVTTITVGMPVASITVMLSNQYDADVKLASIGIVITTVFSVLTIPLVSNILHL